MKIVQFSNGKYGVRTFWFLGWWFKSKNTNGSHWYNPDDICTYCMVDTIEEAKKVAIVYKKLDKITYKVLESI